MLMMIWHATCGRQRLPIRLTKRAENVPNHNTNTEGDGTLRGKCNGSHGLAVNKLVATLLTAFT